MEKPDNENWATRSEILELLKRDPVGLIHMMGFEPEEAQLSSSMDPSDGVPALRVAVEGKLLARVPSEILVKHHEKSLRVRVVGVDDFQKYVLYANSGT